MTLQSELLLYLLSRFPTSGVREGKHPAGFNESLGHWDIVWGSSVGPEFEAARDAFIAGWQKSANSTAGDK